MSDQTASDDAKIEAARAEVERTRAALIETVRTLQQRFEPHKVISDAWEKAKGKGADLAEDAVDAVKRRPVATGGVVAALLMFLAREPIRDGVVRFCDAMTSDKDSKPDPSPAKRPNPAKRRRAPRTKESVE